MASDVTIGTFHRPVLNNIQQFYERYILQLPSDTLAREECKETRLQGLKDRLEMSDDPEADVLRQEIDRLEQEIEDLTEFSPGSTFETQAERG
jgi:hypothetical protein